MKRTGIVVVAAAASLAAGCGSDAAGTRTARPAPDPAPAPAPASRRPRTVQGEHGTARPAPDPAPAPAPRRPRTVQGEHAHAVAAWRTALAGARVCERVAGERERADCYGALDLDPGPGRALALIYDEAIGAAATAVCRRSLRRARAAATAVGADVAGLGGSREHPRSTLDELTARRRDGERALARYAATWADAVAACGA